MRSTLLLVAAAILSACTTMNLDNAQNAILTNPSEATRSELTQTISKALNGRSVTIAPDSFTKDSRVIIERRQAIGPDGNPVMGRRFDTPDHFHLKVSGKTCALWHKQAGEFHVLETVDCSPA